MTEFHFIRPWLLLVMMPLSFILLLLYWQYDRINSWYKVCDSHLIPHILIGKDSDRRGQWLALLAILWLIFTIALAGPTWSRVPQPLFRQTQGVVFVIDLSRNMLATDLKPNRLTRMKFKVQDLMQSINNADIGMVAFAGEAYTVSPLTSDANTLATMLPELEPDIMPVAGHNISQGLKLAGDLLRQAEYSNGHIIVLTSSEPDVNSYDQAKKLAHKGYQTSVFAVGTKTGAPIPLQNGFVRDNKGVTYISHLPQERLQSLAKHGDGNMIGFTDNNTDVQNILALLNKKITTVNPVLTKEFSHLWVDQGYWLVWLLVPLVALGFRRGWMEQIVKA
jgi:Ca-activated chloride channel homolog